MKNAIKFLALVAAVGVVSGVNAAMCAPGNYGTRKELIMNDKSEYETVDVREYRPPVVPKKYAPVKSGWYSGLRGGLSFANHGYFADGDDLGESVSFGRQFSIELNVGQKLKNKWRIQADFGLLTKHEDEESLQDGGGNPMIFEESAYYASIDGIYGIGGGFYAGAGVGMAITDTGFSNWVGAKNQTSVNPMGVLLFGYEYEIGDDIAIDLGVRASAWYGSEQKYTGLVSGGSGVLALATGFAYNLAAMIGIKYNF
jgi:hypothetical protein